MSTLENKNEPKEINLLQLLKMIGDWLVKVVNSFLRFVGLSLQLIVKYWILTLIVLLISVFLGQYLARPSARKYKAGAVAMLYGSRTSTAQEVSRQLQNSFVSEESFSLANKLAIPDSVAKNILAISNYNVIDYLKDGSQDMIDLKRNHSLSDTTNLIMQDRLYIQVITKNVSQIPVVQDAILKYFNNNPTMKGEFEIVKKGLEEKINVCDNEIARLDSLAKVSYFKDADKNISLDNNKLVVGEQRKQLFFNEILQLQDIKTSAQHKLVDFRQPINFTSGFIVNPEPINSRLKYLIFSFLIGISLSVLSVFIIDNFKCIYNYLTKRK